MTAKDIYREFSAQERSLPIFSHDWWLDAAAGPENWNAAVVEKGNRIVAAMPFSLRRRYGLTIVSQPALTQKLGPWLQQGDLKPATLLANERECMQALIDQLPAFDHFSQNWHHSRTNWLPFCWNGFRQTTRYTYVLTELADLEKVWFNLQDNIRGECRKALHRCRLTVRDDLPLDDFLALNRMTFSRQGLAVPYSDSLVRRIDAACSERDCRKFFIAVDGEGRHHAGVYIVWDGQSAYGLMIGSDPAMRTSGAVSLCFWDAIRHAAKVTGRFDFCGSMLQSIERFFRGFGAKQVPYFSITKTSSRLLRMRESLLSIRAESPESPATSFERTHR